MLRKKSRIPGGALGALAVVLAAGLAACGGSADSPAGPGAPLANDAAKMVVLSQTLTGVEPGGERVISFSLPRAGTLELTVRWNDPSNTVIAVLTAQGCADFRNPAAGCTTRRSTGRQGKEGREEFIDYPGARGGYFLLVRNLGPGTESIRVTVELTPDEVPPSTPTPYPTSSPN